MKLERTLTAGFWLLVYGLAGAIDVQGGVPVDSRFQESLFGSGSNLGLPVRIAWAPDGSNRLFVIRYHGTVHIIKDGQLLPEPFAKIEPIYANGECGLLGVCFDPNYGANGYIYFFVTVSPSEQQIIRYRDQENRGVDKTVIVSGLPTLGNQHNGGALAVGPDGKLYWAIGDNGERVGAKDDLTTLASKIGRANLDGSIPNDNPFVDGDGPNNDYIWAYGFRNPFCINFQPATGQLWLNVVGNIYEQIFVVGRGEYGGWDEYERNYPPGALKPAIKYRTNRTDRRKIALEGAVRADHRVTITTEDPHGFFKGEKISIHDVNQVLSPTFYGSFHITSVPTPTSFTFDQVGLDEISGSGRAETLDQGGSVTGGTFYNSTAFPPEFWGNYFYGDYNSGRIMRVAFEASGEIQSIDYFVSGVDQFVDITVGPDGALYYVGHNHQGAIYRLGYHQGAAPELVVEPSDISMIEGGVAHFSVRLSEAPSVPLTVSIQRAAGSAGINVTEGAELVFTSASWSEPQRVTLGAEASLDGLDSSASFLVSAPGVIERRVEVHAAGASGADLMISQAALEVPEGGKGTFTVYLASAPASELTVQVAVSNADTGLEIESGTTLIFTSENYATPQQVVVYAGDDANLLNETVPVTITAPGQLPREISVVALDDDPIAPTIISSPPETAVAGAPFSYRVQAGGNPPPEFALVAGPEGMQLDASTGVMMWLPGEAGTYEITVAAQNGVDPDATQQFTLAVLEDKPPSCVITKPADGQVVAGNAAEWFGDGFDDVGVVQAEFYVDDVLHYTDVNTTGHYHFGGEHLRWDTTMLSDGVHRLRLVVRDTAGQTSACEVEVTVSNSPVLTGGFEADVDPRPTGTRDGAVAIADWVQVGRFVAGLDPLESANEFQRIDCAPRESESGALFGDGVLSIADWVQAGRYAAGLDPVVTAAGPTAPVDAENVRGLTADVTRQIRVISGSGVIGNICWVGIELAASGDENAIGFSLQFDPTQMRYREARVPVDATANTTLQVNQAGASEGKLGFAIGLPAARMFAPGSYVLLEIAFELAADEVGTAGIELSDQPVRRELSDAFARPLLVGFQNGAVQIVESGWVSAKIDAAGVLSLIAAGAPGREYRVETSEDLVEWSVLDVLLMSDDGTANLVDSNAPQHASRFYRLSPGLAR